MITKNEVTTLNLSPTKKDFFQIWNELLEVAGKLSERWDPTSTNESDPGIVILKALAGIADKLNYNIDKNTLEAFMPTAAQEESMRKLCDMLGYNIKYYRSAKTNVTIKYHNPAALKDETDALKNGLNIPKFTVITSNDQNISYFITDKQSNYRISSDNTSITVECMEGQLVKCESINDNDIITVNQISEDNRYYLPETQIAENGIFIYNVFENTILTNGIPEDGISWKKVDNLNVQPKNSRVYKFGFDSYENCPYIEFPDDYGQLFAEGIFIYYTRTSGIDGNISPKTLTHLEIPSNWEFVEAESFTVENPFAATSGSNIETVKQAYNNFKKTIGTFDTLITCRDYMNKVYTMTNDLNKPYVSNILVTDIRNDLNRSITICSCNDAGIFYKETPLIQRTENIDTESVEDADGNITTTITKHIKETPAIDNFDLVFYPFKSYNQIKNNSNIKNIREVYDASFTYTTLDFQEIKSRLETEQVKLIAHNLISPRATERNGAGETLRIGDVVSINNYLKLDATIATNTKLTSDECNSIIESIKMSLANAFNMRELDFGEEIPFESIIETIEKSDSRIKVASLNDPAIYTTFSVLDSIDNGIPKIIEYAAASDFISSTNKTERFNRTNDYKLDTKEAKQIFNRLALRNILAGRIPLFNYDNTFSTDFSESPYLELKQPENINLKDSFIPKPKNPYTTWIDDDITYFGYYDFTDGEPKYYATGVPDDLKDLIEDNIISDFVGGDAITDIKTECDIPADEEGNISEITLEKGEYIKFRSPNLITTKTYPAYVNYRFESSRLDNVVEAAPAVVTSLFDILKKSDNTTENKDKHWAKLFSYFREQGLVKTFKVSQRITELKTVVTETELCDSTDSTTGYHVVDEAKDRCKFCGKPMFIEPIEQESIEITVADEEEDVSSTVEDYLIQSGCIRLANDESDDGNGYKAILSWAPQGEQTAPERDQILAAPIILKGLTDRFITSSRIIEDIQTQINEELTNRRQLENSGLPTECGWRVTFEFEYVPFEAKTFDTWKTFIKSQSHVDFKHQTDYNDIFWTLFGEGYEIGKYVTDGYQKIKKFNKSKFNSLPYDNRLANIYLAESLGQNASNSYIANNEEYALRDGEYLYIEYTPASVSSEGTAQSPEHITEIHGPGTIIRPSGFEPGLKNSDPPDSAKTVIFNIPGSSGTESKRMCTLGVQEQIELREISQVALTSEDSNDINTLYVYKNFNNCDPLEIANGQRKYTLKDGEYIFYTDQNKLEFAFFGSGTEVILKGTAYIPKCDIIDIAVIFDSGIQEIPWTKISLSEGSEIIFREYKYLTLGQGDTLKSLSLCESTQEQLSLNDSWQYCRDVEYTLVSDGNAANPSSLPIVNINLEKNSSQDIGDGWQVCSLLELDVSPKSSQVLRNTEQIQTKLKIIGASSGGSSVISKTIFPTIGQTWQFKTNINCQINSNQINIDDAYLKPENTNGFEIKLFTQDKPVVVTTAHKKVVPIFNSEAPITNLFDWPGLEDTSLKLRDYSELWNAINLSDIRANDTTGKDQALRLSINLNPNTYGIVCFYVDYSGIGNTSSTAETWIEVTPGFKQENLVLISTEDDQIESNWKNASVENIESDKFLLNAGINCVRFNKSGRYFIKTSNNSQGILYFDDIKLVKTEVCEYIYNDEEKGTQTRIPTTTYGLNLDQIGYYFTDENEETITKESRKILKDSTIKQLRQDSTELLKINTETKLKTIANLQSLIKVYSNFVDIDSGIITDLNRLSNLSSEDREHVSALIDDSKSDLEALQELLKALQDNKDINDLEELIWILLNKKYQSVNIVSPQQLMQDYKTLVEKIVTDLETLSTEQVLNTFDELLALDFLPEETEEAALTKFIYALIVNNLVINKETEQVSSNIEKLLSSTVSGIIEQSFDEGLTDIADRLTALYAPKYEQLVSILSNLQSTKQESYYVDITKLMAYIENLRALQNTVDTLIIEMHSANLSGDYRHLHYLTLQTRETLEAYGESAGDISLEQLINEKDLEGLQATIEQLGQVNLNDKAGDLFTAITNLSVKCEEIITTNDTGENLKPGLVTGVTDGTDSENTSTIKAVEGAWAAFMAKEFENIKDEFSALIGSSEDGSEDSLEAATKHITEALMRLSDQNKISEQEKTIINEIESLYEHKELLIELHDQLINYVAVPINTDDKLLNWQNFTDILSNDNEGFTATEIQKIKELFAQNWLKDCLETLVFEVLTYQDYFNQEVFKALKADCMIQSEDIYNYFEFLTSKLGDTLNSLIVKSEFKRLFEEAEKVQLNTKQAGIAIDYFKIYNKLLPENSVLKTYLDNITNEATFTPFLVNMLSKLKELTLVPSFDTVSKEDFIAYYQQKQQLFTNLIELVTNELTQTEQLNSVLQKVLFPVTSNLIFKISDFKENKDYQGLITTFECKEDGTPSDFMNCLYNDIKASENFNSLISAEGWFNADKAILDYLKELKISSEKVFTEENFAGLEEYFKTNTMSPQSKLKNQLEVLRDSIWLAKQIKAVIEHEKIEESLDTLKKGDIETIFDVPSLNGELAAEIFTKIFEDFTMLVAEAEKTLLDLKDTKLKLDILDTAFANYLIERQLLADIRKIDINRDFYYSAPTEASLAIDFNEGNKILNTLRNPTSFYDINNINNNFVISKIDMDYLTTGIKIAKSSRFN